MNMKREVGIVSIKKTLNVLKNYCHSHKFLCEQLLLNRNKGKHDKQHVVIYNN